MPLPGYAAPAPTDTTLIVGVSIFLSFFVFTFIACFCCQGCPLNKFYIRKRISDGNVRCPACRHRGHIPMVLSNGSGLVATCASTDCQPMLLGQSTNGFAAPYPFCDSHRMAWNRPQGQPLTEVNVIYPTDDPPPYRESYTDKAGSPISQTPESCVPVPSSCYRVVAEDECDSRNPEDSGDGITENGITNPSDSAISNLTERGQHVLVDVLQEAFVARSPKPSHVETPQNNTDPRAFILPERARSRGQSRDKSVEREKTLDRTTVV